MTSTFVSKHITIYLQVIQLLIKSGAHLHFGSFELGEKLCMLARQGETKKLECYRMAGANLGATTNMSRQTPMHAAVETAQESTVTFLLEKGVGITRKDVYGRTPLDIARLLNRHEIIQLLTNAKSKDNTLLNLARPN